MNNHWMCGVLLAIGAAALAGCTPVVQPRVSPTEFLVAEDRIPGRIDVLITEAFRSHTVEKSDVSEFKKWQFELGPVTVDALRFALETRFEKVSVKLGDGTFPVATDGGFYSAVQPSFGEFKATDPVVFRFENYGATVGLNVTVLDAEGGTVLSKSYVGEGTQRGSIGYADPGHAAYPVAVQNAVKDAVAKLVDDLVALARDGRAPGSAASSESGSRP